MAIAFVNGVALSDPAEVTSIDATAQSHASGNSIIVLLSNYKVDGPVAVASVTDTAGNSYIKIGTTGGGDALHDVECWFAANIVGNAANVVTATFARETTFRSIAVAQYSGLLSGSFDANSTFVLTSSGTTHVTGNVTTVSAGELLVGGFVSWAVAVAPLSTSGTSTLRVSTPTTAAIALVDRIAGAAGSYSTELGTSDAGQYVCSTFAFQELVAGDFTLGMKVPRQNALLRL